MLRLILCFVFCLFPVMGATTHTLSYAFAVDDGVIMGDSAHESRPMMSVMKLHLAIAVLQEMQREGTSLDENIDIPQKAWEQDTWSPLRAKYRGQKVSLSLRELLHASVSLSDNITTDVLIDYLGGMSAFQKAMQGRAVLLVNEADMSANVEHCRLNRSTAAQVVQLVRDLRAGKLLNLDYQHFLTELLIATETGTNKIKALLPTGTIVGHKTGSSGRDAQDLKIADNDAGFILLPDGRVLTLCIFVTDASLSDDECAAEIARIAQELYQTVTPTPY